MRDIITLLGSRKAVFISILFFCLMCCLIYMGISYINSYYNNKIEQIRLKTEKKLEPKIDQKFKNIKEELDDLKNKQHDKYTNLPILKPNQYDRLNSEYAKARQK